MIIKKSGNANRIAFPFFFFYTRNKSSFKERAENPADQTGAQITAHALAKASRYRASKRTAHLTAHRTQHAAAYRFDHAVLFRSGPFRFPGGFVRLLIPVDFRIHRRGGPVERVLPDSAGGIPDAYNTLKIMRQAPVLIIVMNTNGRSPFESINTDDRISIEFIPNKRSVH